MGLPSVHVLGFGKGVYVMHGTAREEESKLLKRYARKPSKSYCIESRMPNSPVPAFRKWSNSSRYETKAQRDQALHDLRKTRQRSGILMFEYRGKPE